MDAASPIAERNAGQTSDGSGDLFTRFVAGFKPAANARPWLPQAVRCYRGSHHPSATGYGHPG